MFLDVDAEEAVGGDVGLVEREVGARVGGREGGYGVDLVEGLADADGAGGGVVLAHAVVNA